MRTMICPNPLIARQMLVPRHSLLTSRTLALTLTVVSAGCGGARIIDLTAQADSPVVIAKCEVANLAHRMDQLSVVGEWGEWQTTAPVPLRGGEPQPEMVEIELKDWHKAPHETRNNYEQLEVRFYFKRKILSKKRIGRPWQGKQPPGQELALRPGPSNPVRTPSGPGRTTKVTSNNRNSPNDHTFPGKVACALDAKGGSRFVRLNQTPNSLVKMIIDVKSKGDSRKVHEVTWWRIELLDEGGLPMGTHVEEGFVDVGRTQRAQAQWRLDGSPVILEIASGSDAGDEITITFE